MRQRTFFTLGILAAGILWLAGESFILIPSRVESLINSLSNGSVLILGVLFILSALVNTMALFIPAKPRQRSMLLLLSTAMLILLTWLYLRAGFYMEGLLISGIVAAHLMTLAYQGDDERFEKSALLASILVVNGVIGIFLFMNQAASSNPVYQSYTNYRGILAWSFLLSSLAAGLTFFYPALRVKWILEKSLTIPWLLWALIFISAPSLPSLLSPILLAAIMLAGEAIPWLDFALPEGDILGRRLILLGSIVLCIAIGFIAILLDVIDQSLQAVGAAPDSLLIRESSFALFTLGAFLTAYGVSTIAMTINGLMRESRDNEDPLAGTKANLWSGRVARYIKPFSLTRDGLRLRLEAQADQITVLTRQLTMEKRRTEQLTLLAELSQQLEAQLDQPVAAQLTLNTLERAITCNFICLYLHEAERREYVALASAGRMMHRIPAGYRQNITQGVIGRATRTRKTQVVNDTRADPDYIQLGEDKALSSIVVPLIYTGHVKGIIEIESDQPNAFSSVDVALAETMSMELVRAWERSSYQDRLMELIQAGISLSTMMDPIATVQEIATIARQTLEARFTYVSLLFDREENLTQKAHSGQAPRLLESLEHDPNHDSLLKASLHALQPFRVRDIRKYSNHSKIEIDHNGLRSLLVVPIRLHRLNIGSILAFGKQGEVFFTENDEALSSLLASEAAAAIESVWLQQELRATLRTTRLLYELSYHIIQAEELRDAARHIAEMAHRLAEATVTGIVLFKPDRQMETELEVDSNGVRSKPDHPMDMIEKVMKTGRIIYQSIDQNFSRICLPIQTPMRKYGALWLTVHETRGYKSGSPADLQTLTNQAALALERAILLVESRRQAQEIEAAYRELELAYDRTLAALISALDARDRETEGHSLRVSQLAGRLGVALGMSAQQLKALERGSLLHDIGKIGISDTILHKPGPLTEVEWASMRLHPDIGARIVDGIPFLQETLPLIRYHQERWNGSGYPIGLKGKAIPALARLFAVVDAFDALTSNRPYRQKISAEEAVAYLRKEAGNLFDPEIVAAFEKLGLEGQADFLHEQ
jgi:HD-GYP domain-containing protein (c-di-GMP phosphodiesterase class II)/putative methionine-R-sulfoxide reductase with GAF domain